MPIPIQQNKWIRKFYNHISEFKLLFPQNKKEVFIYAIFFILYLTYSIYIAINTSIIDTLSTPFDTYFSFDNTSYFHKGYQNLEGHPLITLYVKPILVVGNIISLLLGSIKAKTVFIVLVCNYFITSSILYIYRYLSQIINLKGYLLYLLIFFYAIFSTNLILNFTFESFTLSAYILSFITYYYSYKIKNNESVPFIVSFILGVSAGGITITNFGKSIIPLFFTKDKLKVALKKALFISVILGICFVFVLISKDIFNEISRRYVDFADPNKFSFTSLINLFGFPIVFPELTTVTNTLAPRDFAIMTGEYVYIWEYLNIGILFLFFTLSILFNLKNKYMLMLSCILSTDIVIHAFLLYGINEPFIYGGHWVFLVPLILGWLYIRLPIILKKPYIGILSTIVLVTLINNIIRLQDFIDLATTLYPNSL